MEGDGAKVRVIAGTLHGKRAPTNAYSDLLNADIALEDGATFRIDAEHIERGIYIVSGSIEIVGQTGAFGKDRLVVFKPGAEIVLRALGPARMMAFGGEPLGEPRHIFWNFVSSSRERIEHAAEEWRERRFPGVPGDDEFIPLPGMPPKRWS
jgi:redox-sensitive bicupin YhaK (pirin superfamily)